MKYLSVADLINYLQLVPKETLISVAVGNDNFANQDFNLSYDQDKRELEICAHEIRPEDDPFPKISKPRPYIGSSLFESKVED